MNPKSNQSTLKSTILWAIALCSAYPSVHTYAGSDTSTMSVRASVAPSCFMDSSSTTLGTYDGVVANASMALEAMAAIVSTCTSGAAAIITINAGASAGSDSADAPARRMIAGEGNYLAYQVYSDVGLSTVWGNTSPTDVAVTGTGVPQTLTAYGSVTASQLAAPGIYTDQLTLTITY